MIIKNIKITNFKSIYGTQEFDFDELNGLIKLSGPIGAGKTTIAEAILYGLFGTVKGQNNGHLVSWNTKFCEIEMNIVSNNKHVHIIRNSKEPLIIEIDGHTLAGANKLNTQEILETEIYDVPKLAITKMCVISFNAFNSLAAMTPAETRQFLDDIFGFKVFSEYAETIADERKSKTNESVKLNAIYDESQNQLQILINKRDEQQQQLSGSIDLQKLSEERKKLVNEGVEYKAQYNALDAEYKNKEADKNSERLSFYNKKMEYATLGKQYKEWLKKFECGVCPTCGQEIGEDEIEDQKEKMQDCAKNYRAQEALETEKNNELTAIKTEHQNKLAELTDKMNNLRTQIGAIDQQISNYNNSVQLINENYDNLITEAEDRISTLKDDINKIDAEILEWTELHELFAKKLRYKLLDTLIPHINKSIQFFINKLEQNYKVQYDQEFKPHIFVDSFEKEIAYNNLSTGQRKSLDMAIIFGVLQNVIANIDFNVLFLDELFSNLDTDSRNTMLDLLNESLGKNKSIFIVNHAEMSDDYFDHKIRVKLRNLHLTNKNDEKVIVYSSNYEQIM